MDSTDSLYKVSYLFKGKERRIIKKLYSIPLYELIDIIPSSNIMKGLKPIAPYNRIVGPAVTVKITSPTMKTQLKAISIASSSIIVIDAKNCEFSVWGGLLSNAAKRRGVLGVIVDGVVTDIKEIIAEKFPVFARKFLMKIDFPISLPPSDDFLKSEDEIGVPVICGEVLVNHGDYIVAEGNTIIVIPKNKVSQIINKVFSSKHEPHNYNSQKKNIDLDKLDRAILDLLQKDARMSYAKISKILGVKEQTIRYRIIRLIKNKVIKKFTIVIDYEKLGKGHTSFIILWTLPEKMGEIIKELRENMDITEAYMLSERGQILLKAVTRNRDELTDLFVRLNMLPGVIKTLTLPVMKILKE